MKKILIGVLIILLAVMAYFAIFKGISINEFEVLSVENIMEENEKLTAQIAETETLMYSSYKAKNDELETSVTEMLNAKDEYLDLADVSTDSQLNKANKEETYNIEYLWTKIGSYATAEGINLKLDVTAGDVGEADFKNLSFSANGNYIAILNFVRSIEDDSKLAFRIESFKILPGTNENDRQATFMIRNVRMKQENTTTSVNPVTTDNTNTNSTNTNTNNTNTDNTITRRNNKHTNY